MNINCGTVGVAGFYTFLLNGVPVFETPSKNLITDFGWARLSNLGQSNHNTTIVQVGSGNTTPTTGDTALVALLAQVAGNNTGVLSTGSDANGNYSSTRITFDFAQGAVVGNVAEVGFKVLNADASLTSRSLVKDGSGNPAVIVVTAIDQLTVQYELRYYRASLNITSSVLVAGVTTTYILRTAAPVAGTSGSSTMMGGLSPTTFQVFNHYGTGSTLGASDVAVSGTATSVAGLTVTNKVVTVNPTNTVITFSTSIIATGSGNSAGGVLNIQFNPGVANSLGAYGALKANFSPAIPKDNTKTLQYSFSFTFTRL